MGVNSYKGLQVVMVCQSAGQTRFRALKHENGIDGSATIIVKVIACFQPLQDCQVCYDYILFPEFIYFLPRLNAKRRKKKSKVFQLILCIIAS